MELRNPENTLDLAVVKQLREIAQHSDPTLFNKLVDLYHHDCARYVATINESATRGDLTPSKQAAHSLKSASLNMGAVAVAELCVRLEYHPETVWTEEIAEIADSISNEYQHACHALKQLCEVSA